MKCFPRDAVKAGSHRPVDSLISGQATPTINDTYGSLVSANPERRSGFRNDVSTSYGLISESVLTSYRLINETVISASSQVYGMKDTSLQEFSRVS
jgi:hypothetical protein